MITVSKKGFTRPSFKGKTGSKSVQFIQRPSRFIIETESVGPSFVDGLSQHIAKLLRAFRAKAKGVGNSDSTTVRTSTKKKKKNKKKKRRPLTPKEKKRKQRRKNKRRIKKKLKRLQRMKKMEWLQTLFHNAPNLSKLFGRFIHVKGSPSLQRACDKNNLHIYS